MAYASTPRNRPMDMAQSNLMSALTTLLINDLAEQFKQRAAAIDAIVAYCPVEEPPSTKVLEARVPPPACELVSATESGLLMDVKAEAE